MPVINYRTVKATFQTLKWYPSLSYLLGGKKCVDKPVRLIMLYNESNIAKGSSSLGLSACEKNVSYSVTYTRAFFVTFWKAL